jgi:hypothetical protein
MKIFYLSLFRLIAAITERLIYALGMYPTNNPNTVTGVIRTAYPDGSKHEYLGAIKPSELTRKKVKAL